MKWIDGINRILLTAVTVVLLGGTIGKLYVWAQTALNLPPLTNQRWVSPTHDITVRVSRPPSEYHKIGEIVIEHRQYTADNTGEWVEVDRFEFPADAEFPYETKRTVTDSVGGWEYRGYAIGPTGLESENRLPDVNVACVPGQPPDVMVIVERLVGDTNLDGLVNAIDVQLCVNAVLGV